MVSVNGMHLSCSWLFWVKVTWGLVVFLVSTNQWFLVKSPFLGTSRVVQWLGIHLPMQGTWVRSLDQELRFHMPQGNWAQQQVLKPTSLELVLCNKRSHHKQEASAPQLKSSLHSLQLEKVHSQQWWPSAAKNK